MWLGANDLTTKFTWLWQTALKPLSYTNWDTAYGNPSNSGGVEDCLQMWMDKVRSITNRAFETGIILSRVVEPNLKKD